VRKKAAARKAVFEWAWKQKRLAGFLQNEVPSASAPKKKSPQKKKKKKKKKNPAGGFPSNVFLEGEKKR